MKNTDLQHRLMKLDTMTDPETSLDRSRTLKSLQVTKSKLLSHKKQNLNIMELATKEVQEANRRIKEINMKMAELHPQKGFIVTEHALLRYLERFEGIDINRIHDEIMKLPEKDKVKANNTIITVYPTPDDHFNLAENESQGVAV